MNWIFGIFSGDNDKKADLTNKEQEFERKVEANDWIKETMATPEEQRFCVICDDYVHTMPDGIGCSQCWNPTMSEAEKQQSEANLASTHKTAAYELGDTSEDTIKKDYKLALSGMSDYNLAEMLAELKCSADLLATLDFNEEKDKILKSVKSNRSSVESKILSLIGEHSSVNWKEAFKKFEEVDTVHPDEKDLYDQMPSGKWRKKTKFAPLSDKEKVEQMEGVGKEEEKGALAKDASLKKAESHLKPVDQVQTADEARQIAIDWQHGQSDKNPSYGELVQDDSYFAQLVSKFPELAEEFKENGITSSKKTADEMPMVDAPLADSKPKLDDKITTKIDEKIEEKAEDIAVKIEEKIEEHADEMAEKVEQKIEQKIDEAFNKAPDALAPELPVEKKEPKEDKKDDKEEKKDDEPKEEKKDDDKEKSENPFEKKEANLEIKAFRAGDKGYYHGKPATIKDMYLNTFSGDATMEIECEGKVVHISGKELKNLNNEPLMEGMEHPETEITKKIEDVAPPATPEALHPIEEISSKASKADVIKKFALLSRNAEIDSPWGVVKNSKGEEIVARVAPTLREKKSKEKSKKVDIKSKENI